MITHLRIPCPPEGTGVNAWTWYAAKSYCDRGVDPQKAIELILKDSTRSDPRTANIEATRAVERAYAGIEARESMDAEIYAKPDPDLIDLVGKLSRFMIGVPPDNVVPNGTGYENEAPLYVHGVSIDDKGEVNRHLFPENYEKYQFVCPNPVKDPQAGRTRDNILEVRRVVVEFDQAPSLEWQWAAHTLLSTFYRNEMVVFSGNKSLHGWYSAPVDPEFYHLAMLLGADKSVLNRPEQWVRMPGGTNEKTRKTQRVLCCQHDLEDIKSDQ